MCSETSLIEEIKKLNDKIDLLLEKDTNTCIAPLFGEDISNIPKACQYCSNHPLNGGSGICHCTLGLPKITC